MATRHRAREIVLQMLYERDCGGTRDGDDQHKFIRSRMQGRSALTKFGTSLLNGTLEHRDEIDERLAMISTRWKLSRMAMIDRNVLRLAAYEMMYGVTPPRVAVNEAILLAKRYGDAESSRFVNGVLDRLMKELQTRTPQSGNPDDKAADNDDAGNSAADNEGADNAAPPHRSSFNRSPSVRPVDAPQTTGDRD